MDVKEIIRAELNKWDLSASQAAIRAGMPASTVQNILNGKTKSPTIATLDKLSLGAFGASWSDLVKTYEGTIDVTPSVQNIIRAVREFDGWDDSQKAVIIAAIKATGGNS